MTAVGEFIEVIYYPGAVWEVYWVDDDVLLPPGLLGASTWIRPTTIWASNKITVWPPSPPCFYMRLFCPAIGEDYSDYPIKLTLWKTVTVRSLCEMEVLIRYAEWKAPPFEPRWLYLFPWEQRIDPPNCYDVPKRFHRRRQLRAA